MTAPLQQRSSCHTITPGSHAIRPTRAEAEENVDAFYAILDWARKNDSLTLLEIGRLLNDKTANTEANTSKKISNRTFEPETRRVLLNHVFGEGGPRLTNTRARVLKEPHALYFALLSFVGTRETSQDNARAAIEGTFQFWRHSVDHPGEYVLGKLVFTEDPKTRAVTVEMHQAKHALDGGRSSRSFAEGYFFKVGSAYLMLLHDESNRELRITLFSSFRFDWIGVKPDSNGNASLRSVFAGRKRHLVELNGHVLGIDGARNFFSPIHATLVDDVDELLALDEQLDVIASPDPRLPRRIETKLKNAGPLKLL